MRRQDSHSPLKRANSLAESELSSPTRLNKKIKKGYEMASYNKVLEFKESMSYRKKTSSGEYEPLEVLGNNEELRQFGTGVYLYF